ncbi:hypothetical protein ANCCAN_30155, partial [Ancylostoma caninum]
KTPPVHFEVPPPILPQALNIAKEKPPDNSKLFHILTGARMLQSQRDKQAAEHIPSSVPGTSGSSVTIPVSRPEPVQVSLVVAVADPFNVMVRFRLLIR